MTKAASVLRALGAFVVNVFAAVIVPNFFSNDFSHIFRPRTLTAGLHREYWIAAIFGFAVGYFVYYKWRTGAARWVWLAGLPLFMHYMNLVHQQQQGSVLFHNPKFFTMPGPCGCLPAACSSPPR